MGKILSFASLAKQNKTCFEPHTNWHERGRETLAIFLCDKPQYDSVEVSQSTNVTKGTALCKIKYIYQKAME